MNYQQALDYLFSQLPMFSRIGAAAYKADLHNTIALCEALDNPHTKFKSIHVAGTNGKGSVSHMLAAVLQQADYKTGLYTSPHLKDFKERIKINGQMVSEDFVIDFVQRTKKIAEVIKPSFFELTVAMSFEYFAMEKVDVAVIETGLGGRLDSTNIITPVLSVITNIGYDHTNILGNTLPEIAREKAGIIKNNVPVVIGKYLPETKNVFINKAKSVNAPIYFAQDEYEVLDIKYNLQSLCCHVKEVSDDIIDFFELDLNGSYQAENLCTVLCAERILINRGFIIWDDAEKYGLRWVKKITHFNGRWQVISNNPVLVLDVAHNEDGIKQILHQLSLIGAKTSAVHFVIGMVKDKDIHKVLFLLPKDAHYYFTNAHIPRAIFHETLKEKATSFSLKGNSFDDVNDAIHSAKNNAAQDDIIIVCGSVFVVGEVKNELFANHEVV